MPTHPRLLPLASAALFLVVAAGCVPKKPAERVTETRARYKVERVSFLPQAPETPVEAAPGVEGEAAAAEGTAATVEGAPADPAAPGEQIAEEAPAAVGPVPTRILFDVILTFDGKEPLPGVTLEVTHADSFEVEKETRRHYVETADMLEGSPKQVAFELDGFLFEEGDLFSVEVRPVPPAEQGEYREYVEAGR